MLIKGPLHQNLLELFDHARQKCRDTQSGLVRSIIVADIGGFMKCLVMITALEVTTLEEVSGVILENLLRSVLELAFGRLVPFRVQSRCLGTILGPHGQGVGAGVAYTCYGPPMAHEDRAGVLEMDEYCLVDE